MELTDQQVKMRLVYLIAAFGLLGFVLELGPVAGAFPLVITALRLELPTLNFLAYLALAASAAIGLHLSEEEPTPKEESQQGAPLQATTEGSTVREYARVRPDLYQLRMLLTALIGYTVLKGATLAVMWPQADELGIYPLAAFPFGLIYIGLAWFVMMQFLRWYAQRRRWIRLQEELVGVDVTRVIAVAIVLKPLHYFITQSMAGTLVAGPLQIMALLLHLAVLAIAVLLWFARPFTLRRTIIGLAATGGVIVLLTLILALIERSVTG